MSHFTSQLIRIFKKEFNLNSWKIEIQITPLDVITSTYKDFKRKEAIIVISRKDFLVNEEEDFGKLREIIRKEMKKI